MSMSKSLSTVPTVEPTSIDNIRDAGQAAVARQQQIGEIASAIEAIEWGSGTSVIKGSAFSEGMRRIFAEFCHITRANPMTHVDVLGGKPYLNATYWSERISSDPYFIDLVQVGIGPDRIAGLNNAADAAKAEAAAESDPDTAAELRAEARGYTRTARECALAMGQWGVPAWATHAYVTTVRRYQPNAPLDKIRNGDIDGARFESVIEEANWAGGRPKVKKYKRDGGSYETEADPVGNAEPAKTARTRSLRRAAVKGFPAWMQEYDRVIQEAEGIIEAEWSVIRTEQKNEALAVPAPDTVNPSKEPGAATGNAPAAAMPIADTGVPAPPARDMEAISKLSKVFLAIGMTEKDARKKWATDNGLPADVTTWGGAQYTLAWSVLSPALSEAVAAAITQPGISQTAIEEKVFGGPPPAQPTVDQQLALLTAIAAVAGAEE